MITPKLENCTLFSGLRRSLFPIKVAGITFGSQESLDDQDCGEKARGQKQTNPFWKFGDRRENRRSVTPLRKNSAGPATKAVFFVYLPFCLEFIPLGISLGIAHGWLDGCQNL